MRRLILGKLLRENNENTSKPAQERAGTMKMNLLASAILEELQHVGGYWIVNNEHTNAWVVKFLRTRNTTDLMEYAYLRVPIWTSARKWAKELDIDLEHERIVTHE